MPAYGLMAGTVETTPWRCKVSSQSRNAERRSVERLMRNSRIALAIARFSLGDGRKPMGWLIADDCCTTYTSLAHNFRKDEHKKMAMGDESMATVSNYS